METRFPLKDLIPYRIYQNKSIIELEVFDNFKFELNYLIKEGYVRAMHEENDPFQYPYDLVLTTRGISYLFKD